MSEEIHFNSKYKEEYAELAYKFCLLGATDKMLADFFDTTEKTVNAWKHAHPAFLDALKRGKEVADSNVAASLYHRALGYSCPESKVATFEGKITDTVEVTKHYPPDPTAAIFWLKNRQPKSWRDRREISHETSNDFEALLGDAADDE